MTQPVRVRGRLKGRHIELESTIERLEGDVEVLVQAAPARRSTPDVLEVIAGLSQGSRSKANIDQQLADEREGWQSRG